MLHGCVKFQACPGDRRHPPRHRGTRHPGSLRFQAGWRRSPGQVSLRVIMETLGHNQIGVTMNTYAHVIPALREDATARMEAFLQSAP